MLSLLHIENIAVIECADISFNKGFNVLTGETGAGKSIVIDAISAILGERAYRDMIRTGSNRADVRAVFTDVPHLNWFDEYGVQYDPETIIQREIYADGKNVCKVNGSLVTVSILHKLGVQLINIHGQHDSASLFDESNHLQHLDAFSDNNDLREDYTQKYAILEHLRHEIERMTMDESEKLRKVEMLRHQISEIEKANLKEGEDEALESRRKILQNAEKLSDGIHAAVKLLSGSDDSDGASSLIAEASQELKYLVRHSDAFESLFAKVEDLMYQTQDIAEEIKEIRDSLSYSSDELEQIESRLDVIYRLRRKYGATCADILQYYEQAKSQLDEIEFSEEHLQKLKNQYTQAKSEATIAARLLHDNRVSASKILSERIRQELSQLDMPNVDFCCNFTEVALCNNGIDAVAFYMTANAGEALKPLSKVASGGELARIMLALKNVLADRDHTQTLIFDEVDSGVSGRAAQKVAEKLKSVAMHKQVLSVTHLPQIAALADTHFLISKQERSGRTYTSVTALDLDGRKHELARIIGGTNITENTLKSAGEMLQA